MTIGLSGRSSALCAALLFGVAGTVQATDLAPNPELDLAGPGLDFALAGSGLDGTGVGSITIQIDGPVVAAYLYWGGRGEPLSDLFMIDTTMLTGESIGSEMTPVNSPAYAFRADVTSYIQGIIVPPGQLVVSVEDPFLGASTLNGVSLLVAYEDPAVEDCWLLQVFEGSDYTYHPNYPDPSGFITPVTFMYDPFAEARAAELGLVVGDAEPGRPDRIEITDNASVIDELDGSDGPEWDSEILAIDIPAGVGATTVELISPPEYGAISDSLHWIVGALRVPCAGEIHEGCTPGYWKQEHHFDSWSAPYTPQTLFSDVFEDAFPGKTLLQVLKTGGGGKKALGRHTVAALLNAASPDVNYAFTAAEVISMFNDLYPATKPEYIVLKNIFQDFNQEGCPLN